MTKPWQPLTATNVAAVPGQLGVFQVASAKHTVLHIGYAGGREPFGLRSALERALEAATDRSADGDEVFRFETTHGYLTRWEELLMVHQAMHGILPPGNADHPHPLGRLTIT